MKIMKLPVLGLGIIRVSLRPRLLYRVYKEGFINWGILVILHLPEVFSGEMKDVLAINKKQSLLALRVDKFSLPKPEILPENFYTKFVKRFWFT